MQWVKLTSLSLVFAILSGCADASRPATSTFAIPRLPPSPTVLAGAPLAPVHHIFVIVMENKSYSEVIGNPAARYENELVASYGLATRYYAVAHPSLPNYLALLAGDTLGVRSDCVDCFQDAPNLVDELEAAGHTWRAYMEDLPAPCSTVTSAGRYDVKHDPFLYFRDIRDRPQRCRNVVPLAAISRDLSSGDMADFVWITPNENHNSHDAPVETGDDWLRDFVPQILGSPAWMQGGLLFITWDEGNDDGGCCGQSGGGHVPLVVIAPGMRPGARTASPFDHYGLLRAIEDLWQLPPLGHSSRASSTWLADLLRP